MMRLDLRGDYRKGEDSIKIGRPKKGATCPSAILSGDGKPHGQSISAMALEGTLYELIIDKFNTSEHHREPAFRTGGVLCRAARQYRGMLGVGHGSGLALTYASMASINLEPVNATRPT